MHACYLVHLAGSVAAHAGLLFHARTPFPPAALERYWIACKCRQEDWSRALKEFSVQPRDWSGQSKSDQGSWIQPVLEEVLTTEVLCRVWTAACELADAHRGDREASSLATGILEGHREMRDRVLNLLVYGHGIRMTEAVAINALRIRNERWTDTLLALIGPAAANGRWSFQPWRVRRLATTFRYHESAGSNHARSLVLSGLATTYHPGATLGSSLADWNRQIACSVLGCFPPHVFDAVGQPMSVQQLWLWNSSSDNQGQVDVARPREPASSDDPQVFSASPPAPGIAPRRFDIW